MRNQRYPLYNILIHSPQNFFLTKRWATCPLTYRSRTCGSGRATARDCARLTIYTAPGPRRLLRPRAVRPGTVSGACAARDGRRLGWWLSAKYEYFPFGRGRRGCLGYRFARWEMLVLLATLLARLEISRPPGYHAPQSDGSVTLRPAAEFHLSIRRREPPTPTPDDVGV